MNAILLDAFRHNAWATRTLLDFCADLTDEQLMTSTPGVYGGILPTLQHLVLAEAGYHRLITGIPSNHPRADGAFLSLKELSERASEVANLWEMLLGQELDVDRTVQTRDDDGTLYDTAIGAIIAQILNHGNEHRAQVCTVLTTMGVEPPILDGWAYGIATGRAIPRSET